MFIFFIFFLYRSYVFYRHLNIKKNEYNVRLLGNQNSKETPTTQGIELSKTTKNHNISQTSIGTIKLNPSSSDELIRTENINNNKKETKSIKIMSTKCS